MELTLSEICDQYIVMFEKLLRFFNNDFEKTKNWFETFNPNLGEVPITLIISGKGEIVLKFINEQLNGY